MADDLPLSTRIAFGLGPAREGRARGLTLAESYRLACWSGLIRPRWPGTSTTGTRSSTRRSIP
jgi:hypothetical protein